MQSETMIRRRDAIIQGLRFYFSGKPCKQGHFDVRYVSSKECFSCMRLRCVRDTEDKKERHRRNSRRYRLVHPERVAHSQRKSSQNPHRKLASSIRARVGLALSRCQKGNSVTKSLGCSISELMKYLQAKFTNEMTWENRGLIWELDHIKPLHQFDLSHPKEFAVACHYSNLQPLLKQDHKIKTRIEQDHKIKTRIERGVILTK